MVLDTVKSSGFVLFRNPILVGFYHFEIVLEIQD